MGSLSYILAACAKRRADGGGGEGWLGTWGKRLKITISNTNVDSDLTNFPILVYLSAASGIGDVDVSCIFDELTSDANRTKIAVTTDDGETECYVEIERWDDANEVAWLWVKVPSVTAASETELYIYYDSAHAANTDKVGDIDSTPGHNVWDANFKAVYHMRDATTSTVKDSTSTGNDGTKTAAYSPIEIAGKIDKGQSFDGVNDRINIPNTVLPNANAFTISGIFYNTGENGASENYQCIVDLRGQYQLFVFINEQDDETHPGEVQFYMYDGATTYELYSAQLNLNTYYYFSAAWDGETQTLCMDGGAPISQAAATPVTVTQQSRIGKDYSALNRSWFKGILDEIIISDIARSAAWHKATYYSNWDGIAAYGAEEE